MCITLPVHSRPSGDASQHEDVLFLHGHSQRDGVLDESNDRCCTCAFRASQKVCKSFTNTRPPPFYFFRVGCVTFEQRRGGKKGHLKRHWGWFLKRTLMTLHSSVRFSTLIFLLFFFFFFEFKQEATTFKSLR